MTHLTLRSSSNQADQLASTPYLAGSSANMLQCMNHLASFSGLCEDELWDVGFNNPLKLIGKDTWATHTPRIYRGICK